MKTALVLSCLLPVLLTPPVVLGQGTASQSFSIDAPTPYGRVIFDVAVLDPANTVARPAAPLSSAGLRPERPDSLLSSDEYEARIRDIKESVGPYSPQLREEYESLGQRLQRTGEHDKAIVAFESAIHIERVNNGLFTPQQIPLIKRILGSYNARAEFDKAGDQHEYLYYIQQRAYPPKSPEALAAKVEWADWNLQYFLSDSTTRPLSGERLDFSGGMNGVGQRTTYIPFHDANTDRTTYLPQRDMFQALRSDRNSAIGMLNADDVLDARLDKADKVYEQLAKELAGNERALAEVVFRQANLGIAIKRQMNSIDQPSTFGAVHNSRSLNYLSRPSYNLLVERAYSKNRDSLEALATQQEKVSALEGAEAWINAGDWELAFGHFQSSKTDYQKGLDLLAKSGLAGSELDTAFNPVPLIMVPTFATHPFTRAFLGMPPLAPVVYRGFMDIAFALNDMGSVKSLTITDASPNTSIPMRRMLLDYLRNQPMRPLVLNGKLVKESALTLRVYYAY